MVSPVDRWLLGNRTPLVGGLLRRAGMASLSNQDSILAAKVLARELVDLEGGMRAYALKRLRRFTHGPARAAICREWVGSRDPDLQRLLREEGWGEEVQAPVHARVLCLLNLGRREEALSCSDRALSIFIKESREDSSFALDVREAIATLEDDAQIGRLVRFWIADRGEDLRALILERAYLPEAHMEARVYAALLQQRREEITGMSPKVLSPLAAALHDADETVRAQARLTIGELSDARTQSELANKVCAEWAECRAPELEELMLSHELLAKKPPRARVLSALKLGKPGNLYNAGVDIVEPLLEAIEDPDAAIAEAAPGALRKLTRESAQDAVCRAAMSETGNPHAEAAALEADYLPSEEINRAGWLFLTEQWTRYDNLDFDRRLLRAFYEAAPQPIQQRITQTIRKAGRTEFLTVLGGGDYRSRAGEMREDEASFMVSMLIQHGEWKKLWNLVFELSLKQSVRAVTAISKNGWLPEGPDDRDVLKKLTALSAQNIDFEPAAVTRWVPPAVRRATANIKGRINDIAMSPCRPLLAIGTNDKRAALWNFQTGEIEESWRYKKVVGRVAFTANDHFVCIEGKASGHPSTLRVYEDGDVREFEHPEMITGVAAAGDSRLLITRRDETVLLFDAETGQVLGEAGFDFWSRDVSVAPDGETALLMHEGITLVGLPHLDVLRESTRYIRNSVIKCGAYAPGGKGEYLVGTGKGNVILADHGKPEDQIRVSRANLYKYAEVAGIASLEHMNLVITADMGQHIDFYDWETRQELGRIDTGKQWNITSLHVSANGDFVSVGHRDDSMSFWDMRVVDIPRMFARPLARAAPRQLGAVQALKQQNPHEKLKPALDYLECVLQYRFRYDIEIDELQSIRVGEFDIEID